MLYIIEVIIYTAAMLLIYMLFLRNRPLYQFSRYYLIASAILPLLLPWLRLPENYRERIQYMAITGFTLPSIEINNTAAITVTTTDVSLVWWVYSIIAMLLIAWQLWNGYRLWRVISKNKKQDHGAYSLVIAPGYGPGSFGRYIFFPEPEINETILKHEQAHIQLHHTFDILLLNLMQAIAWPNLFLIWIRKELKEVHEFQADALVHADKESYMQLLLCSVFNTTSIPIMHSFIIHPIKRRIMMLYKKGTASPVKAGLMVVPAFFLFFTLAIAVQSCNKTPDQNTGNAGYKSTVTTISAKSENSVAGKAVLNYADKMPEPTYDIKDFLARNIHYPEYARKSGIAGRVIVKFIVDENGNVLQPVVLSSPDQSLSDETIRVMNTMPKWTPGENKGKKVAVYFVLPVVFKLDNN